LKEPKCKPIAISKEIKRGTTANKSKPKDFKAMPFGKFMNLVNINNLMAQLELMNINKNKCVNQSNPVN